MNGIVVMVGRLIMRKFISAAFILLTCVFSLGGQEVNDTLKPSYSTAYRSIIGSVGEYKVSSAIVGKIISPSGSADIIKFLQTMPGISSGAEGSSAIYVRGGNLGGNVLSLDGVPIYGSSHLLGYTSIYNGDLVSESVVRIGGFHSSESNMTSSHIALKTIDADTSKRAFLSADNFSIGASLYTPVKERKLFFIGGVRYYPVGLEYGLLRGLLSDEVKKVDKASAGVYDVFGKLVYKPDDKGVFRVSLFLSQDRYRYDFKSESRHKMDWSNLILNLTYDKELSSKKTLNAGLSLNRFRNTQGEKSIISDNENNLNIGSSIDELTLFASISKEISQTGKFNYGIKSRAAILNPGSSAEFSQTVFSSSPAVNNYFYAITNTIHAQLHYLKEAKYEFLLAGRFNVNSTKQKHGKIPEWKTTFDPELSIMAQRRMGRGWGLELTADALTGYYHNLEGVPLGWSLDMIIPSGHIAAPEKVKQVYGGLYGQIGPVKFKIGAYNKTLKHLIYFEDATKLFGSALAGWEDNIKIGEGKSYGVEFLAEKNSGKLHFTFAYTYSKTDRRFEGVNKFEWFPAKFDRPHILNLSLNYSVLDRKDKKWGIRSFFTYQSGHLETVPGGEYQGHLLGEEKEEFNTRPIYWYASVNNYRFPAYIRLDLGIWYTFVKGEKEHHFNIGIYNTTNRHNPFSVVYEPESYRWKRISILPVMPSISYKMIF